jgi:hypothetical protein
MLYNPKGPCGEVRYVKFCQEVKLKIEKLNNFGAFQSPKEAREEGMITRFL